MKANYLKVNYSARGQNTDYDAQLIRYLLSHAEPRPDGGSVLDVACGTGGFRETFQKQGFTYFGIDIDNTQPENSIARCDIGHQPFPFSDDRFDVVFFKMGIEHLSLQEISHCLSEIRRVLKPQGAALILTPDWRWMYKIFYDEYTHQTPFTPSSLRTALEMNGLKCRLSHSLLQLPIVWEKPWMAYVCDVAHLLYPWYSRHKFIKYSKERIVFALAGK